MHRSFLQGSDLGIYSYFCLDLSMVSCIQVASEILFSLPLSVGIIDILFAKGRCSAEIMMIVNPTYLMAHERFSFGCDLHCLNFLR